MPLSRKAKVLIIGAGNIAQGFDDPKNPQIRTHIKGYLNCQDFFDVDSILDKNIGHARYVAQKWGIKNYYQDLAELEGQSFDAISICTPDITHEYYLDEALLMKPKVIFIEKPLNLTYKKASDIFDYCKAHKILLIVNYSRMFLKDFSSLEESFRERQMGKVLSVGIKYHKGFYHNCSHFFNLIVFLLKPRYLKSTISDVIFDYNPTDPSISGVVQMESMGDEFRLNFEAFDQAKINMIEVDILTELNRVIYRESRGSRLYKFKIDTYFEGIELKEYIQEDEILINYDEAMINAIKLIKRFLINEDKRIIEEYAQVCLITTEVMETIFDNYNNSKTTI